MIAAPQIRSSQLTSKLNKAPVFQWLEYILGKDETGVRFSTGAPGFRVGGRRIGDISVDGSWELAFCQYADLTGLTWRRNKVRFQYVKPDGSDSTYLPDFFVEDWGCYIEIKGYETDLDRAKWEQFPKNEKLKIMRRKEISAMLEEIERIRMVTQEVEEDGLLNR